MYTGPVTSNIFYKCNKLYEIFWTYRPKHRHIDSDRFDIPLPRLGLDVDLERIRLSLRSLADSRLGLVENKKRWPMILQVIYQSLYFHTYLKFIPDLLSRI